MLLNQMLFPRNSCVCTPKLQDFNFQKKLGKGTYGSVSKYLHKKTELPYAIKKISYRNKSKNQVLMIQKQIEILYRIQNQYIIRLIDHFEDAENQEIYLIMEYLDGGDLYKTIYSKKLSLPIQQIATIAYQIIIALIELHSNNVIHRDLKLQNIIYLPNQSIKLVDLGCSNYFGEEYRRYTQIGTKIYYSPEVLTRESQDDRLDVWCLGVVIYQLLFLTSPFRGNDIQTKIKKLDYEIPHPMAQNQHLINMFRQIFCYKKDRIRSKQLINHPWIQKNAKIQNFKPKTIQNFLSKDKVLNMKKFLLQQIQKYEQDICKLINDNQKLQRKINFEEIQEIF